MAVQNCAVIGADIGLIVIDSSCIPKQNKIVYCPMEVY